MNDFQNNISIEARKLWNHMHQVHTDMPHSFFITDLKFISFDPRDYLKRQECLEKRSRHAKNKGCFLMKIYCHKITRYIRDCFFIRLISSGDIFDPAIEQLTIMENAAFAKC